MKGRIVHIAYRLLTCWCVYFSCWVWSSQCFCVVPSNKSLRASLLTRLRMAFASICCLVGTALTMCSALFFRYFTTVLYYYTDL